MNGIEAFILGIVQGLTEYLPVSSSGHLALGSALFNLEGEENLKFTVIVHIATVFSTLVIFRKEIIDLLKGLLKFKYNEETKYIINILYSMIPIGIIGLFFKDEIEAIFGSGLLIVGIMFIVTALFLSFSYYFKQKSDRPLTPVRSFVIGLAQALAVLPGLSRSGSTIATGLVLRVNKAKIAQFSFLMVIPPILGEALLDSIKLFGSNEMSNNIAPINLLIGFVAAFISGCIACKWMINIVKKGKLIYFALYCFILGIATIITSQLQ